MAHEGPGGHSKRGSHRLAQVAQCKRKWFLRWIRKLKANVEPPYFLEGTLIHIALAYYRAHEMIAKRGQQAPAWFYEATLSEALATAGAGHPDAIALAHSVFNAYYERFWSDDSWETVTIENEYEASLGQIRKLINPSYVIGTHADDAEVFSSRIDLLYRSNGFLWACDYKSTKKGSWKRGESGLLGTLNTDGEYAVSWQFLLQTAILRINFGLEFRGVIIERILKAQPHDFSRDAAPLSPALFRALPAVLSYLAGEENALVREVMLQSTASEDFSTWLPTPSPWACYSGGSPCEYRPICLAESAGQQKMTIVGEYHTE